MREGNTPARVPSIEEQDGAVGKPTALVLKGSRLSSVMAQGAPLGHPAVDKKQEADVSRSRLLAIRSGKRLIKEFDWPGAVDTREGHEGEPVRCGLVVLTEAEIQEAELWAHIHFQKAKDKVDQESYWELVAHETKVQCLWRCLVDPETGLPFALSPAEIREHCDRDLIAYLVEQYNDWHAQLSPLSSPQIDEEEADKIIDALKKAPKETPLGGFDAASLRLLLTRFALTLDTDSPSNSSSSTPKP